MGMSDTKTLRFSFGRLHCGSVRHFLQTTQMKWPDIRFIESDGWIERDFAVFGPTEKVNAIERSIDDWCARMLAAERVRAVEEQKREEARKVRQEEFNKTLFAVFLVLAVFGIFAAIINIFFTPPLT